MTLSKARKAELEARRARHGDQTISRFPKRKPVTSGAKKAAGPTPAPGYVKGSLAPTWPPGFKASAVPPSTAHLSAAATRSAEAKIGHAGYALGLPGAALFGPIGRM